MCRVQSTTQAGPCSPTTFATVLTAPFAGKAFVLGGQLDHAEMLTSLRESPVRRRLVGQGR